MFLTKNRAFYWCLLIIFEVINIEVGIPILFGSPGIYIFELLFFYQVKDAFI